MTQYTPQVGLTIFPRVNFYKTFGERFDARSNNGRIFGASPHIEQLGVATTPVLVNGNQYQVGYTIKAKNATFTGGNPDNTIYRYRWQTRANSSSSWVSQSWTSYDNTNLEVSYALTAGGQVRLNSQARDTTDANNVIQVNSFSQMKDVTTTIGTLSITPSSVGSCSVDDEILFQVVVTGGTSVNPTYEWQVESGTALLLSANNFGQQAEFRFNTAGTVVLACYVGDIYATNNPQKVTHSITVN